MILRCIPGLANVDENEAADEQAKAGAMETFIGPKPFIGIAYSLAKLTLLNESTNLSKEVRLATEQGT